MKKFPLIVVAAALVSSAVFAGQVPNPINAPVTPPPSGHILMTTANPQQVIDGGTLGTLANKGTGTSVVDPGTGLLESVLPVQTITGASKSFLSADLYKETRRSNSGSAMSDTFPASTATGLVNGTRIVTNNVDATATDTITAGAGTTINSGATVLVTAGRSVTWVYDAPSTMWRSTLNGTTVALTSQPNSFTKPQTFAGSVSNTTAPTVDVVGSQYIQQSSYNLPGSGSLLRPVYWDDIIALPATGSSGIIHEKDFHETAYNWTGTFTLSGESNEFHAFAQDLDIGCATHTSCIRSGRRGGFEWSGNNQIDITGSVTPFYGAYINQANANIALYTDYSSTMQSNAGTIGEYDFALFNGVSLIGAGAITAPYFLHNKSSFASVLLGPLSIGSDTVSPGSQLFIKGSGTSDIDILIKDVNSVNRFILTSDGKLTGSNEWTGITNLRNVPIGLGLAASGAFTTLTSSGLTNINASVNAATNIGTGTTNAAVTIGNSANTTTLGGPSTLSSNTVNLTGSTFAASGCTAITVAATTGALGCTVSDRRLKLDGGIFSDDTALSDILAMPDLHTYQFQYGQGPGGHFVGYFAQDVQAVHPGWVMRGAATELTPDGTLQYDQNHPTPELVGAVKALNRKIDQVASGIPSDAINDTLKRQQLEIYLLMAWCAGLTFLVVFKRKAS